MKFHLFTSLYELFVLFLRLPKVLKAVLHLLPAQPALAKVTIDFEKAMLRSKVVYSTGHRHCGENTTIFAKIS